MLLANYLDGLKKEGQKRQALIEECEQLLQNPAGIEKARIIITTHAKFLHLPENLLFDRVCIVDEDILLQQILRNTHSLSLSSVEQLAGMKITGYSDMAAEIMQSKPGRYEKIKPQGRCTPLTEETIRQEGLFYEASDDINDLVQAGAYVVLKSGDGGDNRVQYFCPEYLPNIKVIVLSATLNEGVYREYFHNRQVIMHKSKEAKYRGKVCQFTYYSLGRRDMLDRKEDVFNMAKDLLRKEGSREPIIITFQKFEKIDGCKNHGLHFGNVSGIDKYRGCSLAVVGTPYDVEFSYKLIASYLGTDVNTKEDERPLWRRITRNGDEFLMMTYANEKLREIQLYAISSELEQCIGRARVLREECTVYVFSCLPCEQAQIETGNYLLAEPPDKRNEREADVPSAPDSTDVLCCHAGNEGGNTLIQEC